jgi:hypothetical protein
MSLSTAAHGHKVKVHYTGKFSSGEVFDSSEGAEPLEFVIGSGQVIPGFEAGVTGMSIGDKNSIVISAENAYGEATPDLIHEMPLSEVPEDMPLQAGMQLELSDNEVIATIIYIDQAGNLYLNIQENQLSELNIDLNNCRMETIRNHYLPIRYKTSKLGRTIHSDVKATTSPVGFVILYMEFSNTAEILGLTPLDRIKFLK